MSRQERERAIIEAFETTVARAGLRGATMQAVAEAAGMSKRTVYDIFGSRDAIFTAWVRHIRAGFVRELHGQERALPLRQRLACLLGCEIKGTEYERRMMVLRAVCAEAETAPQIAQAFLREGPFVAQQIVQEELERARENGEIRIIDCALAAQMLLDMVHTGKLERILDPQKPAPTEAQTEAQLEMALDVFVSGIAI
ncbi:MAG: TetR/AcrR family transcriptional regulator [Neomegalonema sp.]|nr:TetR/AcrR family transcriptional regulator [Neomegalonema sp.]